MSKINFEISSHTNELLREFLKSLAHDSPNGFEGFFQIHVNTDSYLSVTVSNSRTVSMEKLAESIGFESFNISALGPGNRCQACNGTGKA
ncbi:hypothetical protein [Serratia sp. 2723]|uniref:hypothetical protein n=1 Tax=unclassified Serratia (in: enterobacteria) TaxID=2647522 RepID=UPI003D228172